MSILPESRIVLAPLAGGGSTPELAAAVANGGALAFLGAGYLTPDALGEQLERTRALTEERFGVNLFVLRDEPVDSRAIDAYVRELQPDAAHLGVELGEPRFNDDWFDEKLALALAAGAAVISFTFGCPDDAALDRVRAAGAQSWLTVTNVDEARRAVAAGADALVVRAPRRAATAVPGRTSTRSIRPCSSSCAARLPRSTCPSSRPAVLRTARAC